MGINRDFNEGEFVKEISGEEFRDSGALWFVNSILHLFGMAITWDKEKDELKASVCKFRGFTEDINDKGYKKLSNYLKDNIVEIEKDCD